VGSSLGWLLAAAVSVLAWSRLKLARHRPAEVVVGLLAGVLTGIGIYAA
jgi:membrane-associated phospholipid phosphatase